jgi:biopolymer transport protein ExbD
MKYRRKVDTGIVEADLTPMIDVTFQLIAFFMLIINFSEADRAEEILLPAHQLARPPESRPDYQIILNLIPDGSVKFAGQLIPKIDLLTGLLNREISAAQLENVPPKEIAVIIRSHQDTPSGLVQELIAKCQSLELERFSLRVKESKE